MVKKVKEVKNISYLIGDKVVVKTIDWEGNVKHEVAMITNKRYPSGLTKLTYDMRTEKGSAYIYVGIDEKKSEQTIVSDITDTWLENGGENNMYIHRRDGHTRANYSKDMKLRFDGQTNEKGSTLTCGQFEKYNNFHFPTQGPRSF
tara:strand:+ start:146 stop:583 length:438 start_codon:yes stop_codon:yes gene_type:complete